MGGFYIVVWLCPCWSHFGWFCDIGRDLGEYDEFVARICGRLDFFCARLWSFVPSSFPWALKILLHIIKSWNFQDLIRLCSSESSECFLHCLIKHTIYFSEEMIHDQTIKTAKAFLFGSTSIPGPKSSKLWQKNAFPAKQEFGLTLVQPYCKPFQNIRNKLKTRTTSL